MGVFSLPPFLPLKTFGVHLAITVIVHFFLLLL